MAKTQMQLANPHGAQRRKLSVGIRGKAGKVAVKRGKRFVVKMQPQPFMSAKTAMSQIL